MNFDALCNTPFSFTGHEGKRCAASVGCRNYNSGKCFRRLLLVFFNTKQAEIYIDQIRAEIYRSVSSSKKSIKSKFSIREEGFENKMT